MRVLRAITRLNIGGPAIHVAILTRRLDPMRFQSLLVAGREGPFEGSMLRTGRLGDVHLTIVGELRREIAPLHDLRALRAVLALMRRYRPQVVHTHLAKAGVVGRLAARLAGARVVLHTYHGSVFRAYFGARESGLYLTIERALARLSTRVIAITTRQRDELIELRVAPPEKIVVVPLGLDLDQFRSLPASADARRALGFPADEPLVVLVARLVPIKDVGTFLRAFTRLASRTRAHAAIVGDGEERGSLERLARELGVSERCHFLGWQRDMRTVYAAADVVALSSLNEGSPVSLIEAMSAGRPVVATSVGGVPDVVDDDVGALVAPRDPEAMAAALERLVTDADAVRRLASTGRERAFERYSADRLVRDVERLYAELLAEARTA